MSDYKDIFSGDNDRYEKPSGLSFDSDAVKPDSNSGPLTADEINGVDIPPEDNYVSPVDAETEPDTAPDSSKDDFIIGSGFVVSDDYASQIRSRKERANEYGKQRPMSDRDVDIHKVSREDARDKKKKAKKAKQRNPWVNLIWIVAILAASVIGAYFLIVFGNELLGLVGDTEADVHVEQGMSTAQIAEVLEEKDIIDYPLLFRAYVKFKGQDGSLKYGGYTLRETMGYDGIVEQLQKSNERETVNITVPDGATVAVIRDLLVENDVCTVDQFEYVLKHIERYDFKASFVKDIPEDNVYYVFEGYLYPDTYEFFTGADKYGEKNCVHALNKMMDNLDSKLKEYCPDYEERIKKLNHYGIDSLHDALSLASIVQLECSGFDNEMPGVAAVFLNRLVWEGEARYLGSTPTFYYPDNRYNTNNYVLYDKDGNKVSDAGFEGLPPGPQCSMTIESIKSVLYPNETALADKYYYFVTDVNHKFYYNRTLRQHENTIASLKRQGLWA